MRKRLICFFLCFCLIFSGCGSSSPSASGSQDDFLKDMATGIVKRLEESLSNNTDSMSKEEKMQYYARCVSHELKEVEKYSNTVFPEGNFNTLAHLYIDACQMQLAATENYKNNELYTALWDGGYTARAGIIVAMYEQYNLPITEEQANNYRPSYTITNVVTETEYEETVQYEISVEKVTYDIYDDGGCYANVKVRNNGELTLTDICCNVDSIDKNGDVVISSITYYEGRVDAQQACTSGAWFDEIPYAVRVTSGYCIDDNGNWIDFYLDEPYVDYCNENAYSPKTNTTNTESAISSTITNNSTSLTEDEERFIMYFKNSISTFKKPSSIRIVEVFSYDKDDDVFYAEISAENSLGGNTLELYEVGKYEIYKSMSSRDTFEYITIAPGDPCSCNISALNNALKEYYAEMGWT